MKNQDHELTQRLLSHPVSYPFPNATLGSHPARPQRDQIEKASRLLRAYDLAVNDPDCPQNMASSSSDNMWVGMINNQPALAELVQTVETGQAKLLAEYLRDFGNAYVPFGGVTTCIDGYNRRDLEKSHIALTYWDSLIRLSEYLGLHPVENPETGPWGECLLLDQGRVVRSIEEHLGISTAPPLGIIHTDGLRVGDALYHYRHINSLYSAVRLSELSKLTPRESHIVEVGGGIGIAALYANRLGLKSYTILDIPITNLLCANYLINAMPPHSINLFGEDCEKSEIKIMPFWTCRNYENKKFDICLNADSINEIDQACRIFYCDEISRITSDYFLSINHEYFFPKTSHHLFNSDKRFRRITRSPYWPRSGYVEELYKVME